MVEVNIILKDLLSYSLMEMVDEHNTVMLTMHRMVQQVPRDRSYGYSDVRSVPCVRCLTAMRQ